MDFEGEGMPKGNKNAGYVGLMLAKQHLGRKVKDYNPPNEEGEYTASTVARKKKMGKFNSALVSNPSAYITTNFPIKKKGRPRVSDVPKRATAEQRAQMTEEQKERLREYERQKKRESRARQRGEGKPTRSEFGAIAKTAYDKTPPDTVGSWRKFFETPTIRGYMNTTDKAIMISVRGSADSRDWLKTNTQLPFNRLSSTERYKGDKKAVEEIASKYDPKQFEYYLVGHSLGGAIISQLKRDLPFLKDAVAYNPAFQPYDLLKPNTAQITRVYTEDDPLYKLGGRYLNPEVIPTKVPLANSNVKNTNAIASGLAQMVNAYQGHAMANFEGGAKRRRKITAKDIMKLGEKLSGGAKLTPRERTLADDIRGGGWWDDFKSGFMSVIKPVASVAKTVLPFVAPVAGSVASAGLSAIGLGKPRKQLYKDGKVYKGKYHIMDDGSVHTGAKHTKRSVQLEVR